MKGNKRIQLEIERARNRLHELAKEYNGLLHPEVIKQSEILDKLINRFNEMNETKNKAD